MQQEIFERGFSSFELGGILFLIKIDKHINVVDYPGFLYPHCNCMWIEDDINCLIDCSPGADDLSYLRQKKVDFIINSHGHIDHYQYNHLFTDSKILMHQADQDISQSANKYLYAFGINAWASDSQLDKLYLDTGRYRPTRIDEYIKDNQVINLGSTRIEIMHLPGHTPGHCGVWFAEQGCVFTADIELSAFGPLYANMDSSLSDFIFSIERLISLKPDFIISGHGQAIVKNNVLRRLREYRDIIHTRHRKIIDLLHSGHHTLDEITRELPIYGQLPKPELVFYIYEKVMVLAHLHNLLEQGQLIQDNDCYYLKEGVRPDR